MGSVGRTPVASSAGLTLSSAGVGVAVGVLEVVLLTDPATLLVDGLAGPPWHALTSAAVATTAKAAARPRERRLCTN
jgi:hypothetical protein